MNKSDIVNELSNREFINNVLSKREVKLIVDELFSSLAINLSKGRRVEIRGFGCFSLKRRAAGKVRNPRHGVSVESPERNVLYFRAGKELAERVNKFKK